MNYSIEYLQEKIVVGLSTQTGNFAPDMSQKIGGLWKQLFEKQIYFTISNKVNSHSIGLYSNYSGIDHEEYTVTVGCEVSDIAEKDRGYSCKVIPSRKYAKFVVHGDMVQAVINFWQELDTMKLKRTYTGDFEEYISTQPNGVAEIHIYIAIE